MEKQYEPMVDLVTIRKRAGFNQQMVADQIGVHKNTYARWERGEASPDVQDLKALSKLFRCSIDSIVGNKEGLSPTQLQDLYHAAYTIVSIVDPSKD